MQLLMALGGLPQHLPHPMSLLFSSTTLHSQINQLSKFPESRQLSPKTIRHTHHLTATAASTGNSSDGPSSSREDPSDVAKHSSQPQESEVSSHSPRKPPQPEEFPSDVTELVQWGGTLPSSRRIVVGAAVGLAVALGSDFIGITSLLLGLAPDLSRELRADLLYPVQGFKRCYETSRGFGECLSQCGSTSPLQTFGEKSECVGDGTDTV